MYDPRNSENGWEKPSEGYCDQPYVVKTLDGAWLFNSGNPMMQVNKRSEK